MDRPDWGWEDAFRDGRSLLVNGPDKARIWDSATGEIARLLPFRIGGVAFSPDGRRLALAPTWDSKGQEQYTASIWDLAAGKELHRLVHPPAKRFHFTALGFTPDGQTLLTVTVHQTDAGYEDNTVLHRWDVRTGKSLGTVRRAETYPWRTSIGPDGRTVAVELPKGVLLVDAETEEDFRTIAEQGTPAFSPEGNYLFIWTSDGAVSMWEVVTGSVVSRFCIHSGTNIPLKSWPMEGRKEPRLVDLGQPDLDAFVVSPDGRYVATSERYDDRDPFRRRKMPGLPAIRIWEVATGKEHKRLEGFRARSTSLAFCPDGSRLGSWFHNGTVLIWDTSSVFRSKAPKRITPEEMNQLWADLAMEDGGRAFQAVTTLETSPAQTIDWLSHHLHPVPSQDSGRLRRLLKSLDSESFADREAATKKLKGIVGQYDAVLRQALENNPSLEARRRLSEILATRPRQIPTETLRTLRSISILETIGSPEARQVLSTLTKGEADARESRAAKYSLDRLARRSLSPP